MSAGPLTCQRARLFLVPLLLLLGSPRHVSALPDDPGSDETESPSPTDELLPAPATSTDDDPRSRLHPSGSLLSSWSPTRQRWFVSARADVGYLFFRPRVQFGYGIPHQAWSGGELVPILSGGQIGAYAGLRYRHPRVEVRSGAMYSNAFARGFLTPSAHYDVRDLETIGDSRARFFAWDSELTLSFPLGVGHLQSETQFLMLLGVPSEDFVFVDTLGVVVAPDSAIRQQLRYTVSFPWVTGFFVGPAVEAVLVPEREAPWVVRAGLTMRFWMYQDFQLRTDILPTVWSPDTLGRIGSPSLTISARFLWATD